MHKESSSLEYRRLLSVHIVTNTEAGPDITELRGPDGVDSCLQSGTRASWNERYSARGMPPGAEANQFVVAFASGLSPRRVLDLGCGQGRNAVWLALEGHSVTGIDQAEVAIGQATQLAAASGVEVRFETGDIVQDWVPTPGSFDLVVLSYLQLPAEARTVAHAKVRSALADGGTVFLVAHHSDNLQHGVGGPPYPQVLFDEATLAADFAALRISTNKKIFRDVAGADGEIRQAHDILLVAEKPRS